MTMKNQHSLMIRKIIIAAIALIWLISVPSSLMIVGFSSFHPFEETYYAALPKLVKRLSTSKRKKVIIIGTSSVAFGVNGKLLEEELNSASLDYDVVPFGLYGSLGTKLMIDLSKDYISEGDIVIFQPEFTSQTMSTYFSCKETYRAIDNDFSLFNKLSSVDKKSMILNYSSFVSEKYSYLKENKKVSSSGAYSYSSFDENGDLTYTRENNQIPSYVDTNNLIDLTQRFIKDDFKEYVKTYVSFVKKKNAEIYFHYSPMNASAITSLSNEIIDSLSTYLQESFSMNLLGNLNDSIFEKEYFYDSNFHLNDVGMNNYTLLLSDEIKTLKNVTKKNNHSLMDKPALPSSDGDSNVDNSTYDNQDEDCFEYKKVDDGYKIISLKSNLSKSSLIVPYSHLNEKITEIDESVFSNQNIVSEVTIQQNIKRLKNNMFASSSISKVHIKENDPTKISVGFNLLSNQNISIYVPKGSLSSYLGNYSWSYYSSYLFEE